MNDIETRIGVYAQKRPYKGVVLIVPGSSQVLSWSDALNVAKRLLGAALDAKPRTANAKPKSRKRSAGRTKGKVYYFTCRDCRKRKDQLKDESVLPGLCSACYAERDNESNG